MIASCMDVDFDTRNSAASRQPDSQHTFVRQSDAWAAYGRFVFHSVSLRCSRSVESLDATLRFFRRPILHYDASLLYAFQDPASAGDSIWTTAERALGEIAASQSVDHLNVFVPGGQVATDSHEPVLHEALHGEFLGIANTYPTQEILEFAQTFDDFLMTLGPNNRRHMRGRRNKALKAGLQFIVSSDLNTFSFEERCRLGRNSRPCPYSREVLIAEDGFAHAQPGFFHCGLRSSEGQLLSYCSVFVEFDSAVMMYQLNHQDYPELGLTMTLRGFLIEHCIGAGLRRIVLPMGISGHLEHAAVSNLVTEVQFVRRSPLSLAKALAFRLIRPESPQAKLVNAPGFFASMLDGHPSVHLRST